MVRDRIRSTVGGLAAVALLAGLVTASPAGAQAAIRPNPPFDPTFNPGGTPGIVATNFGATPEQIGAEPSDMALQADGKVILAGSRFESIDSRPGILERFTAGGEPDPTFGTGGIVTLPDPIANVGVDDGGRIVVSDTTGVHRLLPNGDPDPSFTPFDPGTANPPITIVDLAVLPTGEVLIAGQQSPGDPPAPLAVVKLLPTDHSPRRSRPVGSRRASSVPPAASAPPPSRRGPTDRWSWPVPPRCSASRRPAPSTRRSRPAVPSPTTTRSPLSPPALPAVSPSSATRRRCPGER